jgi:hypothetical protein
MPSGRLQFLTAPAHIPEFPDLPYREVVIPPYRFFYRAEAKVVWIVPEAPGVKGAPDAVRWAARAL